MSPPPVKVYCRDGYTDYDLMWLEWHAELAGTVLRVVTAFDPDGVRFEIVLDRPPAGDVMRRKMDVSSEIEDNPILNVLPEPERHKNTTTWYISGNRASLTPPRPVS